MKKLDGEVEFFSVIIPLTFISYLADIETLSKQEILKNNSLLTYRKNLRRHLHGI